jgi:prefoldin beta subunit
MSSISPKVQNQIAQLQQLQQQMQTVGAQKTQYEMAAREARRAIEEMKDIPEDAAVFLSMGTVMMQKKKDEVLKNLNEKVETLELRIKSLEKQETLIQGKFEQLQAQIKQALEGKTAPPTAG